MKVMKRSEAGLATLETALVLPLLLLVLFAVLEFGLAFARLQVVQNAAREGARAAVLFRTGCTQDKVTTSVTNAVKNFDNTLGMSTISFQIVPVGGGGGFCNAAFIRVNTSFAHPIPLSSGLASFFRALPTTVSLPGTSTAAVQPTLTGGS